MIRNRKFPRFNRSLVTGWFPLSGETAAVIIQAQKISELSGGAFDISVGPLVDLWGFGPLPKGERLPTEEQIEQALAQVGYRHVSVRRQPPAVKKDIARLRIDLSAVAKGYAVDALAELLEQQDFDSYLVEVGGELKAAGQRMDGRPWRIAVEKPVADSREVETIFLLTDVALATSGNYRNFYLEDGQRYAHTIDPVSGRPIRHRLASATVLDPNCARADALATALMVMGEEKARAFCERNRIAAYLLIHDNESTLAYMSPVFKHYIEKERQ